FSKVFFLGQRLDFPPEFHTKIFDSVNLLQVQEKAPQDWFHFQQMKLRYCHLYGALPPHKIRVLIQEIQENIAVLFSDADDSIREQIHTDFDQSIFLYEKETLNHYTSAKKRIENFQPRSNQEYYMKHSTLAHLYMSMGRFSDSLQEYDVSYQYAKESKNINRISTYYRNKGLTYYVMRQFEESYQMFTKSLQLSEELQSVEAIQFNKNLLSVLEFEKTGNVPKFEIQRGVPLIQNFLLVHATVQDVDKIFSAGFFVQKHNIHPSLSFLRIYLTTCLQLLIDFGIPFNVLSMRILFQEYMVDPNENPLDHVKDVLMLCMLLEGEGKYLEAFQSLQKALTFDLGESEEDTFSLQAEKAYLQILLGYKVDPNLFDITIPKICYSNQRLMITAIINLCIACYAYQKEEHAQRYMKIIHALDKKYPLTHLHCVRIQEIQKYTDNVDTSMFSSNLFHKELTETKVMEIMDSMIRLHS
ncbi:MAG: hypothetical protein CL916_05950, partial [Deltaproteobacteria bacterium]|nr:hypothetical protein [Deltaproteobacteria bacterium]